MTLLDAALRGTLVALMLLLAGVLLRDRPHAQAARVAVAMALGLCVQVVSATPTLERLLPWAWQVPLISVSVANAVLFWVFVQALFDDEFRLHPVHVATWLAVAGLSALNCVLGGAATSGLGAVTMGLQRAVPLLFAVLAAMAAAAHWRADLVESRRRLRVFIVVTGVAYSIGMLAVRLASPRGRLSDGMAVFDVAALLPVVAVSAWYLLRLSGTDIFPGGRAPLPVVGRVAVLPTPAPTPAGPVDQGGAGEGGEAADAGDAAADAADASLARALHEAMVGARVYRSEDLSVASLAARLGAPEYRLRRVINQRLGHRNFNAFVNGFRLDDACLALADPARRDLPVLSVALEAGFQSIGPFNRAFKAATGLTPTEFRREKLADS